MNYTLELCNVCHQMTNHTWKDGTIICGKCKTRTLEKDFIPLKENK